MPMKAATIRLMYFMMGDLRFAMEMVWALTGVQVQKSCFEMVDGGKWKVEAEVLQIDKKLVVLSIWIPESSGK